MENLSKKDLKINDVITVKIPDGESYTGIITSLDFDGKDALGVLIPNGMGQFDKEHLSTRPFDVSEITDVIKYDANSIREIIEFPSLSDLDIACVVCFAATNDILFDKDGIGDRHYEASLKEMINWRYEGFDDPYELMSKDLNEEDNFLHLLDDGGYIYFYGFGG